MAPVALATETNGSIVMPADRASLYSVRLSPSSTSARGILSFNYLGDSLGWMIKSAEDAALLLNIVLGGRSYTQYLAQSFKGLRIGFLDPMDWQPDAALVRPNEDYNKQFVSPALVDGREIRLSELTCQCRWRSSITCCLS